MTEWTFPDVWEAVADTVPAQIAQVYGASRTTWRDFDRRADGIARTLLQAGLKRQDKVALYLYNTPAYMEASFGAMKASLVPVNTNYRYVQDELLYLWTNADAAAVLFHGRLTDRVDALRARCPAVLVWIHVDDGTQPCPDWATSYETATRAAASTDGQPVRGSWGRAGSDEILIYTGGTTGLPRGVMWRQHDLFLASNTTGDPAVADLPLVRARLGTAPPVGLPAAPLMHGTGFVFAATILNRGGTVVTLANHAFSAEQLLDTVQAEGVTDLCIVGDAFCRPIVEAMEREPQRWDVSSLKVVSSSGMMWSTGVKERLIAQVPGVLLIDFLNSSEASGMGRSLTSARRRQDSARFKLGDNAFVIDAAGEPVRPGSGESGRLAVRGYVPLGYYKDPVKSAATFPTLNGVRCAVPGDYATVEADGSITLLGRGSTSINTGGEKVYPEEVEEAIKTFAAMRDAVVVGVPDARFGQTVAAVVETAEGLPIDRPRLLDHLKNRLAGHKVPRIIMQVPSVGRSPNGKADYPQTARRVAEWLATQPSKD